MSRPTPAPVLVSYRRKGDDVDQRLAVHEDGGVLLDERHRSRDSIWLQLSPSELRKLQISLEGVQPSEWWSPTYLWLGRVGRMFDEHHGAEVWVRRGRRGIGGPALRYLDVRPLIEQLDELRVRAIRSQPR
jgi:hypothetical protein